MSRRIPKKHRLFLHWLKLNRARFQFEPQLLEISKRSIRGRFIGVTPAIKFILTQRGIEVSVFWEGQCQDLIGEFDVAKRRSEKGYYNHLVMPEWIVYYPSRKALWIEESFEPFLNWCLNTLSSRRWLAIYKNSGTTWAKLLKDDGNDLESKDRLTLLEIGNSPHRYERMFYRS